MPPTMLYFAKTLVIAFLSYTITQCNAIWCNSPSCGPCTADGTCILECSGPNERCKNMDLTCKTEEDCDINCSGPYTATCQGATINASTANNVVIDCSWTDSCKGAELVTGAGDITITCNQQNSCENLVVDATNANNLQINCQLTNSCKGIDVQCGSGTCFMNCGGSKNGQDHCVNMDLTCGTGDCRVSCDDLGYPQCNSITVDTTLAKSFTCTGGTSQCAAAPDDFTSAPTTAIPTSNAPTTADPTIAVPTGIPTTYVPTTYVPTTYQPTSRPTFRPTENSVTVEISIATNNVTNVTITDTFTEIITEYLQVHYNGDVSLSVDVINGKVLVTISGNDNSDFDETQLIAYVDTQLQGNDIRILHGEGIVETTQMNEIINKNKTDNNNGMGAGLISLIVIIIVFGIIVLIAGALWYIKEMKINNEMENQKRREINTSIHGSKVYETDIYNEGTGSANIGETMNKHEGFDDTDHAVLQEINHKTKGATDEDDTSNDTSIIIEDDEINTAGMSQSNTGIGQTIGVNVNDDRIIESSNINGEEIITDSDDNDTDEMDVNIMTMN